MGRGYRGGRGSGRKNKNKNKNKKKNKNKAPSSSSGNNSNSNNNCAIVATAHDGPTAVSPSNNDVGSTTNTLNPITIKRLLDKITDKSLCSHGSTRTRYHLTSNLVLLISAIQYHGYASCITEELKEKVDIDFDKALFDPEFCKFLFSTATNILYLKEHLSDVELTTVHSFLRLAIDIRYVFLPQNDTSPGSECHRKCVKYKFELDTARGVINVLSRETKSFCNCMMQYKDGAKAMEKIGYCSGCHEVFPRTKLGFCGGCLAAHYCGKECQKKEWGHHKTDCPQLNFQRCDHCKYLVPAEALESCHGGCPRCLLETEMNQIES